MNDFSITVYTAFEKAKAVSKKGTSYGDIIINFGININIYNFELFLMISLKFWTMNIQKSNGLFFQVVDILNLCQTWQPLFCIIAIMHCFIFNVILTLSSLKTGSEFHYIRKSSLFFSIK